MKKMTYIFTLSIALISALMFSCGGGAGGAGDSFTVGYNANGADSGSAPSAQSGNLGTSLSVKANLGSLAKNGYLFDGWNTKADGSGTDYMPGASYKGDDITLYAKWARLFNYSVNNPGSPAQALNSVQRAPGNPTATITGLTDRGQTLSDITIPRTIDGYTVAAIGDNAFQGCTNVANMLIPDTVTDIGDNAFNGCSNLSGVTMQGTV
ncbi:MAG: InlB B-repeat-containing protein, partial [Spirochaetia bacterium]|nr:InlB B-repeat-containing protein [Spirochaetia bacterium]